MHCVDDGVLPVKRVENEAAVCNPGRSHGNHVWQLYGDDGTTC